MSFPHITSLSDLVPFIEGNPQFRIQEQPNGTTVVCYMLQDEDTFTGDNEEFAKECRGITFDTASGKILSRTLHKFKNVGESEETQPANIPWDDIVRVMDKRDGSMITFVELNGKIVGKTKKTFTSAEAVAATEFLYTDPARVEWVRLILSLGFTPTFEWTSPRFPIVLTYEKDELTLLQIRDNVTGGYVTSSEECPFPIVENLIHKFVQPQDLLELAKTTTGVEGWIIQARNGEMWKIKTQWYCELHHAVTFTRWRDIARTVLEDKSDDLKAAFAMTGRSIEPILEVERKIFSVIDKTRLLAEEHAGLGKGFNRTPKDMAMALRDHYLFSQIMRLFRGQEVNWLEWYSKNYLDTWSLEVVSINGEN